MLIENIENKIKLSLLTVILTLLSCSIMCITIIYYSYKKIAEERNQIYVLAGNIPMLANRTKLEDNYLMEAKSHIQLFHQYFFNLPPDDDYIKWSTSKSLYLCDESAIKQKKALESANFYSDLLANSANCMLITDSIKVDPTSNSFTYYGTEIITQKNKKTIRNLITTGRLKTVIRSANNPHGLLIYDWKTLQNKDIKNE